MPFYTKRRVLILSQVLLLAVAGAIFAITFIPKKIREANLEQSRADFRDIQTGTENYGMDRCGIFMPPDTWYRRQQGAEVLQTFETESDFITHYKLPESGTAIEHWHPLTTPIAYMGSIPIDPFSKGQPYRYKAFGIPEEISPWTGMVWGVGPDGDEDIHMDNVYTQFLEWRKKLKNRGRNQNYDYEETWNFFGTRLINSFYDPTNGTSSNGDIAMLLIHHTRALDTFGETAQWEEMKGAYQRSRSQKVQELGLSYSEQAQTIELPAAFLDRLLEFQPVSGEEGSPVFATGFGEWARPYIQNYIPQKGDIQRITEARKTFQQWFDFLESRDLNDPAASKREIDVETMNTYLVTVGKSYLVLARWHNDRGELEEAAAAAYNLKALVESIPITEESVRENHHEAWVKLQLAEHLDKLKYTLPESHWPY